MLKGGEKPGEAHLISDGVSAHYVFADNSHKNVNAHLLMSLSEEEQRRHFG